MDTTLRDGEQTPDVAFCSEEKLLIVEQLLERVGVDRVEVCSARVSPGEHASAARIARWAAERGRTRQIEALGFVDGERSASWLSSAGITRMNLLVKGSERHCRLQLGMTPAEHLSRIAETLEALQRWGVELSGVYLEDWSRGCRESPEYVSALIEGLQRLGARRLYLPDTLGVLGPAGVLREVRRTCRAFPALAFEFHAHNDYGLATANCLAAVRAGASGLHTTVNGLGERAGNADLAQVAVALRDHGGALTGVHEAALVALSRQVARASGLDVGHNAPLLGASAFTHTAGVHADGDAKGALYCSELAPERFGRRREYALGKLAGRASLAHHLRELGIDLSQRAGTGTAKQSDAGVTAAQSDALGTAEQSDALGTAEQSDLLEQLRAYVVELGDRKQPVRPADLQRWLAPRMLR
jgi:D-citramalate synthase